MPKASEVTKIRLALRTIRKLPLYWTHQLKGIPRTLQQSVPSFCVKFCYNFLSTESHLKSCNKLFHCSHRLCNDTAKKTEPEQCYDVDKININCFGNFSGEKMFLVISDGQYSMYCHFRELYIHATVCYLNAL